MTRLGLEELAQSSATSGQVPIWNGSAWVPSDTTQETILYFSSDESDISTYEVLEEVPSLNSEDDDSVAVTAADGEVLIDSYVTLSGSPGVLTLGTGIWTFHMFHYVDNAGGTTQFVYRVYKRNLAGSETELFNVTTNDVDDTSVTEIKTHYALTSAISLLASDRLVIKVYVKTTSVSSKTAHLVYEGATNVSYVTTTVVSHGAGVKNEAGINNQTGTSYQLQISDANGYVRCNNASPVALIVPADSTVLFKTGTQILFSQLGAGQVTATPEDGTVTINGNTKTTGQYLGGTLIKVAANTWDAHGNLEAA